MRLTIRPQPASCPKSERHHGQFGLVCERNPSHGTRKDEISCFCARISEASGGVSFPPSRQSAGTASTTASVFPSPRKRPIFDTLATMPDHERRYSEIGPGNRFVQRVLTWGAFVWRHTEPRMDFRFDAETEQVAPRVIGGIPASRWSATVRRLRESNQPSSAIGPNTRRRIAQPRKARARHAALGIACECR